MSFNDTRRYSGVSDPVTQPQLPPGSVSRVSASDSPNKCFRDKALTSRRAWDPQRYRVVEVSGDLGAEAHRATAEDRIRGAVVVLDPQGKADLCLGFHPLYAPTSHDEGDTSETGR